MEMVLVVETIAPGIIATHFVKATIAHVASPRKKKKFF